jgi:hypothetical protein
MWALMMMDKTFCYIVPDNAGQAFGLLMMANHVQLHTTEGFSTHPADPLYTIARVRFQQEMNLLVSINALKEFYHRKSISDLTIH